MKNLSPHIFQFLGYLTNGDAGPYTFYRNKRGQLVFFPKTWPKDPATYHQKLNRDKWRHAAVRWRALGHDVRRDWKLLASRCHLTISGYNLFIFYITGNGTRVVETCQRLAKIDVISRTGPPLPYLLV